MAKTTALFLLDSFPEGNEVIGSFYQDQVLLLREDIDIVVVVLEAYEESMVDLLVPGKRFSFKQFNDVASGIPVCKIIARKLRQNRLSIQFSGSQRWLAEMNLSNLFRALVESLDKTDFVKAKPDLIVTQTAQFMAPFALKLGRRWGVPVMAVEHYPPLLPMSKVWEVNEFTRSVLVSSLNSVQCLLSVSQYLTNVLHLNGVRRRIDFLGNYVNERRFTDVRKIKNSEFRITFVGYDHPVKDPDTLFETMVELKQRGMKDLRFQIVSGISDFNAYLQKYDVRELVTVYRNLTRDGLAELLGSHSDLFLSTSTSETFGLSMLEAVVSGVPVVATSSGGNDEFLDPANSVITETMRPKDLADAIVKIRSGQITFDLARSRRELISYFGSEAYKKRFLDYVQRTVVEYRDSSQA